MNVSWKWNCNHVNWSEHCLPLKLWDSIVIHGGREGGGKRLLSEE
jgi:hypothetical protein